MADVRLEKLAAVFGAHRVFEGFTLTIRDGECFTLLGPSGCGKSGVMRMIAGFEHPSAGEVFIGNQLVSSAARKVHVPTESRNIGVVFQDYAIWPHKTVFENVVYPLQMQKAPAAEVKGRTLGALAQVHLGSLEDRYPPQLSGGQQQRVALARALVSRPKIMLLDEPLSNPDPKMHEVMRFEIKELLKRFNLAIIYVTHDQAEAMALSDRIVVMDFGALIRQDDTPVNVYLKPANKFVFSFIGLSNFLAVEVADGRVYMQGAREAGPVALAVPSHASGKPPKLAGRPAEIEMVPTGGVRGVVTRRAPLGDIIHYWVQVGPIEVRVQRNVRKPVFNEGNQCGLVFSTLHWYDESGVRVPTL